MTTKPRSPWALTTTSRASSLAATTKPRSPWALTTTSRASSLAETTTTSRATTTCSTSATTSPPLAPTAARARPPARCETASPARSISPWWVAGRTPWLRGELCCRSSPRGVRVRPQRASTWPRPSWPPAQEMATGRSNSTRTHTPQTLATPWPCERFGAPPSRARTTPPPPSCSQRKRSWPRTNTRRPSRSPSWPSSSSRSSPIPRAP